MYSFLKSFKFVKGAAKGATYGAWNVKPKSLKGIKGITVPKKLSIPTPKPRQVKPVLDDKTFTKAARDLQAKLKIERSKPTSVKPPVSKAKALGSGIVDRVRRMGKVARVAVFGGGILALAGAVVGLLAGLGIIPRPKPPGSGDTSGNTNDPNNPNNNSSSSSGGGGGYGSGTSGGLGGLFASNKGFFIGAFILLALLLLIVPLLDDDDGEDFD